MAAARLALLLLLFAPAAWAADPCAAPAAQPYAGRLIDAMAQLDMGEAQWVVDALEKSRVERIALFARVHRKRGAEGALLGLLQVVRERIILGTPRAFGEQGELSSTFVSRTVAYLDDANYRFVGAIAFSHSDDVRGERYIAPNGANVAALLTAAERAGVPVMLHWEAEHWQRDWPAFDALYGRFPRVTFIWPQGGFASLHQMNAALAAHANVVATLSRKKRVLDACGALRGEWRALLERYPGQFLFASSARNASEWSGYAEEVQAWRSILGQLPAPLAESVAFRNAERLYDPHPALR